MPIELTTQDLINLVKELCRLPQETEWVEFKRNADIAVEMALIKPYDAEVGAKALRYIPFWA